MIEYIKGELTELTPALATVEAAGVGYGLNISLTTYSALQGQKPAANGQKPVTKLYVFESIREDAHVLYGFISKKEREMFELLITVSGVGPNTARMMLSSMSVSELCNAISRGDERLIKGIKGIEVDGRCASRCQCGSNFCPHMPRLADPRHDNVSRTMVNEVNHLFETVVKLRNEVEQ